MTTEIGAVVEARKDAMFARQLDQIYLLLDHISMNSEKHLPSLQVGDKTVPDEALLAQIAAIKYPPAGTPADQAAQDATLILALDKLNRAAAPANGFTVAFTLLVSGEMARQQWRKQKAVGGLARPSSRMDLAEDAFPTLVEPARRFVLINMIFIWAIAAFFLLTCLLSWNVATGNALLGEVNTLTSTRNDVAKQIAAAEIAERSGKASDPSGPSSVTLVGGHSGFLFGQYCKAFTVDGEAAVEKALAADKTAKPAKTLEVLESATGLPLCVQRNNIDLRVAAAHANLGGWLHHFPWGWLSPNGALPKSSLCADRGEQVPTADCNAPAEVDSQWAGALLNVVGGAVLPICYGLLGAGAAVIRGISAKIRASVLAPRDLMLGGVQLVLGAVIGGCIGLFITPAGASAQGAPSLLGSVQLSASALCFIAGFGVEGVFVALESLVHRVFNTTDPSAAKPASPPIAAH